MYRIYNTCIHLNDENYIRAVKYVEEKNLHYIYRQLKTNKPNRNSITVYGHIDQLDEFNKFIKQLGGNQNGY